jgi:hypothetical protein
MLEDFRYAVETEFAEDREAAMIGIEQDAALADLVEHIVHHDPPDAAVPKWLGDDEHAQRRAIPPVQPPHRGTDDLAAHFRDGSRAQRQPVAISCLRCGHCSPTDRAWTEATSVAVIGRSFSLRSGIVAIEYSCALMLSHRDLLALLYRRMASIRCRAWGGFQFNPSDTRRDPEYHAGTLRIMLPGQSRPDRHKRPILRHTVRFFEGEQACGACDPGRFQTDDCAVNG